MHTRRILRALLATLAVLALAPAAAGAYTTNLAAPVIFVHGFDPSGYPCPGYDLQNNYWGTAVSYLASKGWSGPLVKDGYYACDTNGDDSLDGHGSHSAYFGSTGHYTNSAGVVSHNQDADIKHLAYHLAWQIYDEYSSKGQSVQLVTHSMGGLIARWMLYRIQAADPAFPPYLYVQDVVAIAPPNNGSSLASLCSYVECTEMRANSSFLSELNANANNPQATGGTDWTVMTSKCDTVVSASSALTFGTVHKVEYSSPCYGHSDYYNDTSDALDAQVTYANPPSTKLGAWNTAWHALAWVNQALRSQSW